MLIGFLTTLFTIICLIMSLFIYIQQGKGGLGGAYGNAGGQALFGGSGGQNFFEKATWVMVILFICGSLGLSVLKTTYTESKAAGHKATTKTLPKK